MRLYSVEEAREILPKVIPVVEQIRSAFLELRALQAAKKADSRAATGDGHLLENPWAGTEGENRLEELNRQLRGGANQLQRWGIEMKDPEKGLIDFYHERNGQVVFLCYVLGEADVEYWHDLQSGFAGRQPL
jgi:hypothetical protein